MSGEYRTDDMALATLLRGQGLAYRLERLGYRKAVWIFRYTDDETFDNILDEYIDHSAKVEPRTFVQELAQVREELFAFLGEPERRQLRHASSSDAAPA